MPDVSDTRQPVAGLNSIVTYEESDHISYTKL